MKKNLLKLTILSIIIEILYFNIAYDLILVLLLFVVALAFGNIFRIKLLDNLDNIIIKFSLGLGSLGCFIWLNIFFNIGYKSFFLILSIIIVYLVKNILIEDFKSIKMYLTNQYENNSYLVFIFLISFFVYLINASYPIHTYDSLAKHLVIPLKILNNTNYDYNVIESIIFGDYAMLSHMYSVYLLSLGGTKAVVIFITSISFISLIILLRLSHKSCDKNIFINSIAIIYLTTPIVYKLSVNLMIESLSLFFILITILLVSHRKDINKNIIFLGFIVGFSIFVKQISVYYSIPLAIYVLFVYVKEKNILKLDEIFKLFLSILSALIIFLPSILVVYYKTGNPFFPMANGIFLSPYFSTADFKDPFNNVLSFNFDSLWSIVFNTSKNIEMIDGGVGYIFLFLPITLFLLIFKRNTHINILIFISLIGYIISTKLTYNIRYFYPSFILLIPCILYYINYIDKKIFLNKNIFNLLVLVFFSLSSLFIVLHKDNFWGLKKNMLKVNNELTDNYINSVLKFIPKDKNIKVLSNNDLLRGDFVGQYYSLNWYNTFLNNFIEKREVLPVDYLSNFDYYVINKILPLKYPNEFNFENIKDNLVLISETETHKLYKINKNLKILIEEKFNVPLTVSVEKPEIRIFELNSSRYQIEIESENNKQTPSVGRFQINWLDENSKFLGTSITTYNLEEGINVYKSDIIHEIPSGTKYGVLYINSHIGDIKVYSIKLLCSQNTNFLTKLLEKYNQKFPYLNNFKE